MDLGGVIIVYDVEGIGAVKYFFISVLTSSDALADTDHFIGVGLIPDVGEFGIGTELAELSMCPVYSFITGMANLVSKAAGVRDWVQ